MPRGPRIDFPGAWHHVFNRGADHAAIFSRDGDCTYFLRCLDEATAKHGVEVHAFCLMSNHYHLLVRSQKAELSAAMQWLSSRFTQGSNHHLSRDGPLFRGRYQSVLVTTDAQLLTVSRYIHLNPVQAGLAARAGHWPWSSARAYLGGPRPQWLCVGETLALFAADGSAQDKYQDFLRDVELEVGSDPTL